MMSSAPLELIGSVPRAEGPRTGIRKRAMSNTSVLCLQTHKCYIVKTVTVEGFVRHAGVPANTLVMIITVPVSERGGKMLPLRLQELLL